MARKKHAKPHEEEAGEAWLLPYSDLMTLLLALFIALFAMSQTDASKMQALAQAFTAAFNIGGPSFFSGMGPATAINSATTQGQDNANDAYMKENETLREVQEKIEQYVKENNLQDQVSTELSEEGLMIRLKEKALFASGSPLLTAGACDDLRTYGQCADLNVTVPVELGAEFCACGESHARTHGCAAVAEPCAVQRTRLQRVSSDRFKRYG